MDGNKHTKPKIAFVCQRYGEEINGGAELYCRLTAEQLSGRYDVTVYTTCAVDYVTWRNEYPAGETLLNGVRVIRFPTERTRNPRRFALVHRIVALNRVRKPRGLEEVWVKEQGPVSDELIRAVERDHREYRAVFFVTYLYYTTIQGMRLNLDNAILIPTVHDEPPVYLQCFNRVFANAKAIVWNSPEEKAFAEKRFPAVRETRSEITGIGIEPSETGDAVLPEVLKDRNYLLYAGRIDINKGCGDLFRFFRQYKQDHPGDLKLVLIGKKAMEVPEDPDILDLGFVPEALKYALMKSALALVIASHYESLSMVVLESMIMGTPVLVSAHCEVLKGHCDRSRAGFAFADEKEFAEKTEELRKDPAERALMGENGKRYVRENYQWNVILEKLDRLIRTVDAHGKDPE